MAGKKGKGKKKSGKPSPSRHQAGDANGGSSLARRDEDSRASAASIAAATSSEAGSNSILALDAPPNSLLSPRPQPSGSGVLRPSGTGTGRRSVWPENLLRETASAGAGFESRGSTNGPTGGMGSRDAEWRRKSSSLGERERERDMGDRDRDKEKGGPGDECHNGERLGRSPIVRHSADKDWPWLAYSTKQFRSFAQEFPPTLDVGMDEVSIKTKQIDSSMFVCPASCFAPPLLRQRYIDTAGPQELVLAA